MTKAFSFALLVLSILFCSPSFAQVHVGPGQMYVDLATAAKAKVIKAGDTVYLHAGTYRNSAYYSVDSLFGRADAWITIRPFEDDSISINEQYTFMYAQYVRITGLNFYGNDPTQASKVYHQLYFDYQYDCFGAIHDIIVENCTFSDLNNTGKQGSGACLKFTGTDRFLVENCIFRNGTNMADGISMNGNRNGVIRNCTFENLSTFGSHCKGGTKNILYEKNLFVNCAGGGIEVGGDTGLDYFCPKGAAWEADSIKVFSNIFIGGTTGIRMAACHNSIVANNTCFKTTQFAFRLLNASSNTKLENNYVYNNIFTTNTPNGIYMNASANFDYSSHYFKNNLFHDYRKVDPGSINFSEMPGAHVEGSVIGDPMFADTAKRDFSLRKGSPAIGAGVMMSEPATDYYGKPFVTPRSIGASEGGIALGVKDYQESRHCLKLSPNPVRDLIAVDCSSDVRSLDVYDVRGTHLSTSKITSSIDVTNLASGNYVVVARDANGNVIGTSQFIKL
jgi:parallel beta-helix repeat protein